MSNERGKKNLLAFNAERERQYLIKIDRALGDCKQAKMQFSSVPKLAGHLDRETGISRTNLTRNPVYLKRLEEYQKSYDLRRDSDKSVEKIRLSSNGLEKKCLVLELENSNLTEKIKQLEALNARNLKENGATQKQFSDETDYYSAFVNTAIALYFVLKRQSDIMTLNLDSKCIEELGGRPSERLIVGPKRLNFFIDWLIENKEFFLQFDGE